MSPLTCSLLALAAVLAVATAVSDPDPFCGELIQDDRTNLVESYNMERRHGGNHIIDDKCSKPGRKLVGQHIVVCNEPYSKPVITPVNEDGPFPYREVNVDCPSNTYGCENLTIEVTQYCDLVVPPIQIKG